MKLRFRFRWVIALFGMMIGVYVFSDYYRCRQFGSELFDVVLPSDTVEIARNMECGNLMGSSNQYDLRARRFIATDLDDKAFRKEFMSNFNQHHHPGELTIFSLGTLPDAWSRFRPFEPRHIYLLELYE